MLQLCCRDRRCFADWRWVFCECSLALEELGEKRALVGEANSKLLHALAPKDDADEKSALLEIRAGESGPEPEGLVA